MSYECFELEVANGIAHIRLNRPEKANSMIPMQEMPTSSSSIRQQEVRTLLKARKAGHRSCL